jgi:repressor LexA
LSKISHRQQAILEFIKNEVKDKGYPPSVREIGEAVGLASSSTVHGHLERLEKKV